MNYFSYNTDANSLCKKLQRRFSVLIEQGFAAVGGDRQKYGEQLKKLKPNDILLMYQNRVGVVAVGRVCEEWDGVPHQIPKYYTIEELKTFSVTSGESCEYRIEVHWFLDLSDSPVSIGYIPRGTVRRIVRRRREVSEIIEKLQAKAGNSVSCKEKKHGL